MTLCASLRFRSLLLIVVAVDTVLLLICIVFRCFRDACGRAHGGLDTHSRQALFMRNTFCLLDSSGKLKGIAVDMDGFALLREIGE